MKKLTFVIFFLIFSAAVSYSQTFDGDYMLGDFKVTISHDEQFYYVTYSTDNVKRILQYEENTPANEQIWLEWVNAKQTGTYVIKQDYSSGIYTDYRTQQESYFKKIY
ncbi:MAG: hypothetical protein J0M37_12905 [Ignavibacteria bacterium]|nr:hypothetical protein [Ignavibacteria bacterium]